MPVLRLRLFFLLSLALMVVGCAANDDSAGLLRAALDASAPDEGTPVASAKAGNAGRGDIMSAYLAAVQAEGKLDSRYHLQLQDGARTGHNLTQGFDATFDGHGFRLEQATDRAGVQVGTRAIRCGEARVEVGEGRLHDAANEPHRISIARAAKGVAFEEWGVNGPLGGGAGVHLPERSVRGQSVGDVYRSRRRRHDGCGRRRLGHAAG